MHITSTSSFTFVCLITVVGLDSVLADASNVELRCGHRLVTGLFTRPRLPLGYTYVATVPRGACRLNVTELVASENFIALKVTNGSYITNGEFAISSPGTFEAAGARFHYTRTGGRDTIFSLGPIYAPVDIMVLYTQPTPNIRYEYFTESLPGEVKTFVKVNATDMSPPPHAKHTRRHHFSKVPEYTSITDLFLNSGRRHEKRLEENQIGLRRFTWKISSFSQCTRTCGGGIQIGKYRCIEGVDKEVSSVHCVGSPPSSRRRRCNNAPCPPRWRAAAWSVCPMCGPANRTRIVGCVQDHAKGIIKIKDRMCPDTKPVAFELCEIPDCESFETKRSFTSTASYEKNVTENFREGPIYTVSVNSSNANDIGPEYNYSPTIGWIYTEWSDCVGACGFSGVQSRGARCADPAGCGPRTADTVRACTVLQPCRATEGQWLVSEWSACSSDCGGWQARVVLCVGGAGSAAAGGTGGTVLPAAACAGEQPPTRRGCGARCNGRHTWYYSDWTQCIGNCSSGIGWKQRSVVCATVGQEEARAGARAAAAAQCAPAPPDARQPCALACADSGEEPVLKPWLATSTTESSESTFRISLQRCEDQLPNCGLAVQARLCHYNYYTKNCCQSCKGRK